MRVTSFFTADGPLLTMGWLDSTGLLRYCSTVAFTLTQTIRLALVITVDTNKEMKMETGRTDQSRSHRNPSLSPPHAALARRRVRPLGCIR